MERVVLGVGGLRLGSCMLPITSALARCCLPVPCPAPPLPLKGADESHAGLQVYMSWSAAEYLYMVLIKNKTLLPPEALFLIR